MNLALDTALQVATAGLYLLVALALGRRRTDPGVRGALNMFRAWWFLLAAITIAAPLQVLLHLNGMLPVWLFQTLAEASVLALSAALATLLCYLVFAYHGSTQTWLWISAGYAAFAVFLLGVLNRSGTPVELVLGPTGVTRVPPVDFDGTVGMVLITLLLGPQIVASIAFLRLYPKADTPTQRYRIVLVGTAITAWFAVSFLGAVLQQTGPEWRTFTRILGLAAAILVLLAYFPPGPIQRRLRVRPLGREDPGHAVLANPDPHAPQDS